MLAIIVRAQLNKKGAKLVGFLIHVGCLFLLMWVRKIDKLRHGGEDFGYWERWLSIFLWILARKIDKLRQQQERKMRKIG